MNEIYTLVMPALLVVFILGVLIGRFSVKDVIAERGVQYIKTPIIHCGSRFYILDEEEYMQFKHFQDLRQTNGKRTANGALSRRGLK